MDTSERVNVNEENRKILCLDEKICLDERNECR